MSLRGERTLPSFTCPINKPIVQNAEYFDRNSSIFALMPIFFKSMIAYQILLAAKSILPQPLLKMLES